ncbi:MAG: hypothetical protein AAGC70_01405 [Pseudomonadota bacterium]
MALQAHWTPFDSRNPMVPTAGIADVDQQPAWLRLPFVPGQVSSDGACLVESLRVLNPFAVVTAVQCADQRRRPTAVVVMPMSGHFGALLYDLVQQLSRDVDVWVVDWTNARHVPEIVGTFGFADVLRTIADALTMAGPGAHLVAICQSTVPAAAIATALVESDDPAKPASLALIGGPIDHRARPTRLSSTLELTPLSWYERHAIVSVSEGAPGAGRLVYPAETHQRSLLTYLTRHLWLGDDLAQKVFADDGSEPQRLPFLTLYTQVKDISARVFLESISVIYHRQSLLTDGLTWQGRPILPRRVTSLPLITVEAPDDDIAAPGQTLAAHHVFSALDDRLRKHVVLSTGGHFSLFHGTICRAEVVPALSAFWADTAPETPNRPCEHDRLRSFPR